VQQPQQLSARDHVDPLVMSGISSPSPGSLQLTIRLTTHPVNSVPSHHPVTISRTATIAELKQQLHTEWDGKPQPEGIVCVKGGRVCRDQEVLGELFSAEVSFQCSFRVRWSCG
jgi:hypothetical protein